MTQSPQPRMLHVRHEHEPGSELLGTGEPLPMGTIIQRTAPQALPEAGGRHGAGR